MKGIWKYKEFLRSFGNQHSISLGEGNTPLIHSARIGPEVGVPKLYFKLETGNPTGSYKDRFAASAITYLQSKSVKLCLATSSGNTGAALSAYSARAGLPCVLAIVDGAPEGKLNQMQLYGADTLMIRNFGLKRSITENVFDKLSILAERYHSEVQVSAYAYSPEGMQGVETIAFEIAEKIHEKNTHVFSPSGGGGLTLAIGKGFKKWNQKNNDYILPCLHCVQPQGNNTIAGALAERKSHVSPIDKSTTKISGLQVPNIIDGQQTLEICGSLNGNGHLVSDDMVFHWQKKLAQLEGIYCEPAGAVALAGAAKAVGAGLISPEDTIVCVITGHGFKDPSSIERMVPGEYPVFQNAVEFTKYVKSKIDK